MDYPNEELQYVEFASGDLPRIKAFYQAAFDWSFTDWGEEYTSFEGKHVSGGFYLGEVVKGSILPVVYANDLETTLSKVSEAGGEIVRDIFTFPGGRRFHFTDPDGNELVVWSDQGL